MLDVGVYLLQRHITQYEFLGFAAVRAWEICYKL